MGSMLHMTEHDKWKTLYPDTFRYPKFLLHAQPIVELVVDIERMSSNQRSKSETHEFRLQLNEKIGPTQIILPIASVLAEQLSDYAARILKSQ